MKETKTISTKDDDDALELFGRKNELSNEAALKKMKKLEARFLSGRMPPPRDNHHHHHRRSFSSSRGGRRGEQQQQQQQQQQ